MQIKDASCGWNVMSLKRCGVNFILPRKKMKFDRTQLKEWRFVDGDSLHVMHKPEYTYLLWDSEKESNGMTETQEINWV